MANPKRRRPPLIKALLWFLPALASVACAGFIASPLALIPLLLANALAMGAVCHAIGFDPEPTYLRTVLRRGAAHVVMFTTSPGKAQDAKRLGADEVVISKNPEEMAAHTLSFDFILNTVAAPHNLDQFLALLKRDGSMCLVGVPDSPHPAPNVGNLIFKRRKLGGSLIGGLPETQEMLDFCAEHGIVSDIELIPMEKIDEAYDRMVKSDVKYRFVIDMATLPSAGSATSIGPV